MDAPTELHGLFTPAEIAAAVGRLAAEISRDYHGKNPCLLGVLKGSFIFMADLVRFLDFPLEIGFVRLSSYGGSRRTSGRVKMVPGLCPAVKGRDVLVVEDIIDTGLTTSFLMDYLRGEKPASLRLCALVDKPTRRQVPVGIDYLGFTVPDRFLVGYGLDFDERFRHLAGISFLEE